MRSWCETIINININIDHLYDILGTRAEPVWNQPAAPALMEQASEAGELVDQVDDLREI